MNIFKNIFKKQQEPEQDPHEYLDKGVAQSINWHPRDWEMDSMGARHASGVYVFEAQDHVRVIERTPDINYVDNNSFLVDMRGERTKLALSKLREDRIIAKLQPTTTKKK